MFVCLALPPGTTNNNCDGEDPPHLLSTSPGLANVTDLGGDVNRKIMGQTIVGRHFYFETREQTPERKGGREEGAVQSLLPDP